MSIKMEKGMVWYEAILIRNRVIIFTRVNMAADFFYGKQDIHSSESNDCRTTKWFPILAMQGKSLVLSGTAHKRSTWQFMSAKGELLMEEGTSPEL